MKSIATDFLDETHEALEAIRQRDTEGLKEERGDVLLQVVFHSRIEEEKGGFTFGDVVDGICKEAGDPPSPCVRRGYSRWHRPGAAELGRDQAPDKGGKTQAELLGGVPGLCPRSCGQPKVQNRAKRVGFDWPEISGALDALESEPAEFKEALASENPAAVEEELGDLLFSAVNVSRFLHIDAEQALTASTDKFIRRFARVEELAKAGKSTSPPRRSKRWMRCGTRPNDWIRARNQPRWDIKSNGGFIMNKVELIAAVTEKTGMSKKDAEKAVSAVLESVVEAVSSGDKVQLVGFGTFEVRNREARTGRNPRTKESIVIPASKQPVFKAGKAFKDAVAK